MVQELATHGLTRTGDHGPVDSLGVPRDGLPLWDDIQILTAQLKRLPLLDDAIVDTRLVIGPSARKPLALDMPLLIADMAFGAMSAEAKTALAIGAEAVGAGVCSGEGGLLPEEQRACSRYLFQLGPSRFGFSAEALGLVQAMHLKVGQAAKTGTGGYLPGSKVRGRIAELVGHPEGTTVVSPSRFPELNDERDYRRFVDAMRDQSGGIPIGIKMSAQHLEDDLDAALSIGVDYVIVDGRGGGTAAAPLLFRDHIGVPTIAAIGRARRHLDKRGRRDVTLIATGGLRIPADFVKAMALGADGIALASSAIQAIGCLGIRQCHLDTCPQGIATQREDLRARLDVQRASQNLAQFLTSSVHLMQLLARACGHARLGALNPNDLTSWKHDMATLAGIRYAGD